VSAKVTTADCDNEGEGVGCNTPVPVTLTWCGLPAALLTSCSEAVCALALVGLNCSCSMQLPLAASELPQAVGLSKVNMVEPVNVTELIAAGALPLFCTVMNWMPLLALTVWLPKAKVLGLTAMIAAGTAVPEPCKVTEIVPFEAFEANTKVPGKLATEFGAKLTLTVQLLLGAMATPVAQVPAVRYAALEPEIEMLLSVSGAVPLLLMVTVWGVDVVPCVTLAKLSKD
jgi:hypothetical protein